MELDRRDFGRRGKVRALNREAWSQNSDAVGLRWRVPKNGQPLSRSVLDPCQLVRIEQLYLRAGYDGVLRIDYFNFDFGKGG